MPEGSPTPSINFSGAPALLQPADDSPEAANGTTGIPKPLADKAEQALVTSASPTNPLAAPTPSAAALHVASSVDSSPLPPSTANPCTGAATRAMANPFAALRGFGHNPAMPQPWNQSRTRTYLQQCFHSCQPLLQRWTEMRCLESSRCCNYRCSRASRRTSGLRPCNSSA
jgi:hypothetical protein